jgi:hypothetical protein
MQENLVTNPIDDEDDEFCIAGETIWIPVRQSEVPNSKDDSDEDEFCVVGTAILIPTRKQHSKNKDNTNTESEDSNDEEDEFCIAGDEIQIPLLKKTIQITDENTPPLILPENWDKISTDTEFVPVTNNPTIPLTVQYASAGKKREYLHPNHPYNKHELKDIQYQLKKLGELDSLKIFQSPLGILDYLKDEFNIEWRVAKDPNKRRYTHTIKLFLFWSFKDIEFQFAAKEDYIFYALPKLEKIRRITTSFNRPIALPYEIQIPSTKGFQWKSLSLEIIDISAMQGAKSLKVYMGNVGLNTSDKGTYKNKEKSRMDLRLLENVARFLPYIRSDVNLTEIYTKTIELYNSVANMIGVNPREDWGLSTGKITANMVSEWIAKEAKIPLCDEINKDTGKIKPGLYQYGRIGSPEAIKLLSHISGNRNLLYLGMVDGGRCVKERTLINVLTGVLVDIDIMSCYANGLLNQIFPIGNPKIIFTPMKFKDWEKKYSKKLVPGLWVARISWKDAPFKQDILISKEDKVFTAWDFYQRQYTEASASDANRQYDASMYLSTETIKNAALTHNEYQVLIKYSSNQELGWIRENAIIECFAFYATNEEVDTLDESVLLVDAFDKFKKGGLKWNTSWKRVELKKLMTTLIELRTMHKSMIKVYSSFYESEKTIPEYDVVEININDFRLSILQKWGNFSNHTPVVKDNKLIFELSLKDYSYHCSIQEFIKLISNTIYGCIASVFFSTDGTGLSNFIVGNNITARARTLAWCMAKGFYSLMSITDGGVFDVNNVCFYKRKSLDIFANIAHEKFHYDSRHPLVEIKPLYGFEIPQNERMFDILKDKDIPHVQSKAWEHLKSIFGELDIFKYDQFSFEVKSLYTSCEIRNKSDYRLINSLQDKETIRLRGLKRTDEDEDIANHIFNNIAEDKAKIHHQEFKDLVGLQEWRNREELRKNLLPHDEITREKDFYTLTPLGVRFLNPEHRKDILRLYDRLRLKNDPEAIAALNALESLENWQEYKESKKKASKKSEN